MREIKFRGKIKESGEWVYGYYAPIYLYERNGEVKNIYAIIDDGCIGTLEMLGCGIESGLPAMYEIYTDTLGQYTGLKDKNGVEIYEGDLIKTDFASGIWVVAFDERYTCVSLFEAKQLSDKYICLSNRFQYDYEVIGNIYDNPELLMEETK